jgi:hypothetical protein
MMLMYLQKVISRNSSLSASGRSRTKIAVPVSGSIGQRHGSADPDPYQNVTDQQQCIKVIFPTGTKTA